MAPEMESSATGGTLGSIASSFGLDLSDIQSSDAITPLLYPDLMDDNGFIADLFPIMVTNIDSTIHEDLYTYFKKHQKKAWWAYPIGYIANFFKGKNNSAEGRTFDPYRPTKIEDTIIRKVRTAINISVDKKTGVITIRTKAQDPVICKTIADSTREHLQLYITKYRTNKASKDYAYYEALTKDAKEQYENASKLYAEYADAYTGVVLKSYSSKQEDLENDMQLKYNTYSTLSTQLQAAKAKIQEKTPAFTLIQGASVPLKASSPKRMIFVMGMSFFAFVIISLYILKDIVKIGSLS